MSWVYHSASVASILKLGGFAPLRGGDLLSLLVHPLRGLPSVEDRKQRKHTPDPAPSGCPRLLGQAGRSLNSPLAGLRQRDRTPPEDAALLGVPYGSQGHKRHERCGLSFWLLLLTLSLILFLILTSGPLRRRRGAQGKREKSGPVV